MKSPTEPLKQYAWGGSPLEIELKSLALISRTGHILGRAHRADFYHLIFVERGEMGVMIDFEEYCLGQGEMLLIAAGQVCRFDPQHRAEGRMLLFTPAAWVVSSQDMTFLFTSRLLNPLLRPPQSLPVQESHRELFDLLARELALEETSYTRPLLGGLLRALLLTLERSVGEHEGSMVTDEVSRFCAAVERQFLRQTKVAPYLLQLGLREKSLAEAMKRTMGLTPKAYIDRRRTLEIKRQLIHSREPIQQVGFAMGFDEPTNFTKFFLRHTGYTPKDFRRLYVGED